MNYDKHTLGAVVAYTMALVLFLQAQAQPVINFFPTPATYPTSSVPAVPPVSRVPVTETTIALTAPKKKVILDREFPLTVTVNAAQPINAVGATITFPQKYLTVVKLSKEGSMLNLWSEEPSFSNETGTITFSGLTLNGGIEGKRTVLTIVFKSKKVGSASVNFADAQVLAHDGQGTDIIGKKSGITYTIAKKPLKKK